MSLGIFGNVGIFAVFSRKRLSKFSSRNAYIALASMDTICIIYHVTDNLLDNNKINIEIISESYCKLFRYVSYVFSPISAWLIVYISFDKYINICFKQTKILKKRIFQIVLLAIIFVYHVSYYSPVLFNSILVNKSNESSLLECSYKNDYLNQVFSLMDLINLFLIPFSLMCLTSILLIGSIIKSRIRVLKSITRKDKKLFLKDVKFLISTILINIFFIIFNLPICIAWVLDIPNLTDSYNLLIFFYYLSFSINFYILLGFNSIFRNEFFILIKLKSIIR
jgi:hypothetical protein